MVQIPMVNVGIVGGTGYTGAELLRLLAVHPQVELRVITSRSEEGIAVADMFPNLRSHVDLRFSTPDMKALCACHVVFFATPNGIAMTMAHELIEAGVKVIDLAADFRIKDVATWQQWYAMEHASPALLEEAVYGLPELNRTAVANAQLIANPGCYPTAVTLGYLPMIENDLIDTSSLIADTKSGASGAGRAARLANMLCEVDGSFKAYTVPGHRHHPEICQTLNNITGCSVGLTFVPHLVPMVRGIHATLYGRLKETCVDLQTLFEERYHDEPFVDVLPVGSHPETRTVRGNNVCRIAVHRPFNSDTVVILAVIDNLVKGAAGQAVQNMNIMLGLAETTGLNNIATLP